MSPGELDAIRDGLALIEAVHRGDLKAVRCLLDCGDTRAQAVFLAGVADDLVADLSEWLRSDPEALLDRLRAHHTTGAP